MKDKLPELKEKHYRFNCVVKQRTVRGGLLLEIEGVTDWFPESQVQIHKVDDGKLVVDIPLWLCNQNNLFTS